jgi:hypothetical protein
MHNDHNQHTSNSESKKPVFWVFILGLVVLALFLGLTYLFVGNLPSTIYPEDAARDEVRVKNLADLRSENEAKLNSYAWVDRSKGKIQIPIQSAMKLMVGELSTKKPQPAYPIVDPASGGAMPSADTSPMKAVTSIDATVILPTEQSQQDTSNVLSGEVNGAPGNKKNKAAKNQ